MPGSILAVFFLQILDRIPKDQKGKVLVFLALSNPVMSGKNKLDAIVLSVSAMQLTCWEHSML